MTTAGAGATIFLVDDDDGVRRALARVLGAEGWAVESFASAEAFLARYRGETDGCLVLDVAMPASDGLALQRRLAERGPSLPVVFVTGHGDIPMSVQAMKAGAADFLTKPVDASRLVAAVRAALDRQAAARTARAEAADRRERYGRLSAREREVLAGLAAGKLNKQIAADLGIVEQTVKFHRAHLMERMRVRTLAELMHVVAQLRLDEAPGGVPGPARSTPDGEVDRS